MKRITVIILILAVLILIFIITGLKLYVMSKEVPIDVSYKKFEKYEWELKTFAKENDFEYRSHGDCFDESCYKTIILTSLENIQISFDFANYDGFEQTEMEITSSKENINILSLIDYEQIDEILEIVFDKSYKDKLKEMSLDLSDINFDGEGKKMYLDRKENLTVVYFLRYSYKPNTGVKTGDYNSVLMINKN